MYEYTCPACKWEGTVVCQMSARDEQTCAQRAKLKEKTPDGNEQDVDVAHHETCRAKLIRTEIPSSVVMDPVGGFQMGAVTKQGQVVPGHFGASAKKKGNVYKP